MRPLLRPATKDDAEALVEIISMAGEGMPEMIWADMAGPDETAHSVGLARACREEGSFSYRNAWIAEIDGEIVGGLLGYRLPSEPVEIGPDFPTPFIPLQELENQVPGLWYLNVLAVYPARRGQGIGHALLAYSEELARDTGAPGNSIIVFSSNPGAERLYRSLGYAEAGRRVFTFDGWPHSGADAILLTKSF